MILWILLFLLIIAISFILAYLSMRDYQEIPEQSKDEYGLFLVRSPQGFNSIFLDSIGRGLLKDGLILSIERLFKGNQGALTVFGPKEHLSQFSPNLNLLELEDYSQHIAAEHITIWEMGIKSLDLKVGDVTPIFGPVKNLGQDDQFFWQVVLGPKKQGENLNFQTQIRAAIYSKDPVRKQNLAKSFQEINSGGLTKVPKPFSLEMMLDFYKQRALGQDSSGPVVEVEEVIALLKG